MATQFHGYLAGRTGEKLAEIPGRAKAGRDERAGEAGEAEAAQNAKQQELAQAKADAEVFAGAGTPEKLRSKAEKLTQDKALAESNLEQLPEMEAPPTIEEFKPPVAPKIDLTPHEKALKDTQTWEDDSLNARDSLRDTHSKELGGGSKASAVEAGKIVLDVVKDRKESLGKEYKENEKKITGKKITLP